MNFTGRKAILYIRVSTDEQAEKGYSLADQESRLKDFCTRMSTEVVAIFRDDYSAKTFNRPGWKELQKFIKQNRGMANLLLFTNWSRFSRAENMGETYLTIEELNKYGIEPQAIEQPLDFSIPENRLVLAFYIASPMVENLRRSSNTINGMHRSLKEGRWCNHAPFGYMNRRDEAGKPMMVIDEVKAPIIAQVFSDFINDVPPREILSRARKSGFTPKGHSALERVVTNPIYAGMIKVFAYRQEPERIIRGVHGAIISEGIYYAALDKWNAQSAPKPRLLTKELMLRGVVLCDGCGKPLTGGRSKGRSGRHWWYYRCLGCAGHNYSAIEAHGNLHRILNAMSLTTDRVDEFIAAVDRELKQLMKDQESEAVKLRNKLVKLESELNSLEEKYIQEKVAFDTYQKHYPIYRREIASLKMQLETMEGGKEEKMQLYREALPKMTNMNNLFQGCDMVNRQQLLRLLFPSGLIMTRTGYRTARIAEIFSLNDVINSGLTVGDVRQNMSKNAALVTTCPEGEGNRTAANIENLLKFVLKIAA